MKSFVFFGILIATILQTKSRPTHDITQSVKKAEDECKMSLGTEHLGSPELLWKKFVGCVFLRSGLINEHGVLNEQRLEDYFVDYNKDISRITITNLIRKCKQPSEYYNDEKLVKLFLCLTS